MTPSPIIRTIAVNQLCIGLYVHLDVDWLEHAFARNSFKIKNNEQISTIKLMGIKTIRVEPARCDGRPLPIKPNSPTPPEVKQVNAKEIAMIKAKKARIEKLKQEREAIGKCEKEYLKAANSLRSISRKLFSRPKEACIEADLLIQQMLDALMAEKDIAIHLMSDKVAGEDTHYHSLNVSMLAMMLAKEMSMLPEDIKALGIGCLFHDIGKIDIPDRIVNKSFALNRSEQNFLQMHCQYGEVIATKINLAKTTIDIIGQHHEFADGSGYPKQLMLEQISPLARVVAVINTYDNLCNRSNPADSLSPYEALSYMFSHQRKLFDPTALNTFIRCMGVYPPGTLIKLSDGTPGLVVSVTTASPMRPSVLIYDHSVPKNQAIILDLSIEEELEISCSLKQHQLSQEVDDYLSPRKRINYFFDFSKISETKI